MSEDVEAISIGEVIKKRFEGLDGPVTIEQFTRLYAVMAAQQDALLAVYSLAMKANPRLIFEDVAVEAGRAISVSADAMRDALIELNHSVEPEGKGDE